MIIPTSMGQTVTPGADILALRPIQTVINVGYGHSILVFIVFVFDSCLMAREHRGPDSDRLIVARISGVAMRHASWREPAAGEIAAAVAELREVAGDRPDLLAEEAGILLGFHDGDLNEPRARSAAQLLIAAGADQSLIPGWIEEGRRRPGLRRHPPFSRDDSEK
jgi:hypothetical protein